MRRFVILILAIGFALVFSGCSQQEFVSTTPSPTSSPSPEPAPELTAIPENGLYLANLSDRVVLDKCLEHTNYSGWEGDYKIYDNTAPFRRGEIVNAVVILGKNDWDWEVRINCDIYPNGSTYSRVERLKDVNKPILNKTARDKALKLARERVGDADLLLAYSKRNPVNREVESYRFVMRSNGTGYFIIVSDWKVADIKEVEYRDPSSWDFNVSIYLQSVNETSTNVSDAKLCTLMTYEGSLPTEIRYAHIHPFEIRIHDLLRGNIIKAPAIQLDILSGKILEPSGEMRWCKEFKLFEGGYIATAYADLSLQDCLRSNSESECYERIESGSLSFEIE